MPTIAFVNMKGGVGKTTLSVNVADALNRRYDMNVLLVDLDPQFNATQCLYSGEQYIPIASAISNLKDIYAKLCRSSHTIDIQFMAHKIPFSELIVKDKAKFEANLSDFAKASGVICSILYISIPEALAKLSPEQQDFVRSEIPRAVKKALLNA